MNRWYALLVLVAILALVDLVGVAVLRKAWSACHQKAAHPEHLAARVQPIDVTSGPELFVVHSGK
jgi:hypothetical protein